MLNKKNFFGIATIILCLFACNKKQGIEEYDIQKMLADSNVENRAIDLFHKLPFACDSIIVLPPYVSEKNTQLLQLKNYSSIQKKVFENSLNEGVCLLLFVKNNHITSFSVVPRNPFDFSTLKKPGKNLPILAKGAGKLFITRNDDKFFNLSFVP